MTNSNRSINKSDDMIQSNQSLSNSNSEINTTISYSSINSNGSRITNENSSASTNQSVISITSQSRSQKSLNSSDNEHCSNPSLSVSSSKSIVQKVNSCFERNVSDPKESLESIPEDALLFPEVANGETLEIIQNNDFQNLLEEILESTVFNILQEANAGEFDLTQKPAFCYYKTYNDNCRNIVGSVSSVNISKDINENN